MGGALISDDHRFGVAITPGNGLVVHQDLFHRYQKTISFKEQTTFTGTTRSNLNIVGRVEFDFILEAECGTRVACQSLAWVTNSDLATQGNVKVWIGANHGGFVKVPSNNGTVCQAGL